MKKTKIYVSHTWEIITTNPEQCSGLPYNTAMQQISLKEAKKLARRKNKDFNWTYWLSNMADFNLR